jgi:hypothetical protein
MERSRFLASLIGPVLLAVATSLILNPALLPTIARAAGDDPALLLFAGILTLVAGIAIVRNHSVWRGWPAVVTVFGWLAIVGGLVRILLPQQVGAFAAGLAEQPGLIVVPVAVAGLLGLFLTYLGLVAGRAAPAS